MSSVHPDQILQALIDKGCRSDKEAKLRRLHEICLAEYKRHSQGARDLSVGNIARIAESHNLIKQKTMWNAQSADYVTLIKAWEAFNGPKTPAATKRLTAPADKYAFLNSIEDLAVRSMCQLAIGERDKLRAELNMLKAATVWPVDMRPKGRGASNVALAEVDELTDSESRALLRAIDPQTFASRNWTATDTGAVLDERGRPVYDPGYITGINKILRTGNAPPTLANKGKRV